MLFGSGRVFEVGGDDEGAVGQQLDSRITAVADALGLTPVHINRKLQQLRQDQLITLRSKQLIIHDLRSLQQVAGFDSAYLAPEVAATTLPAIDPRCSMKVKMSARIWQGWYSLVRPLMTGTRELAANFTSLSCS